MIGLIVAAHGPLAEALLATARSVVPTPGQSVAVGINSQDDSASYQARLQTAVQQLDSPHGVLILTDMFGGTPSNVGMTMHQPERVEVLTGANLPMLIRAMQLGPAADNLAQLAGAVRQAGVHAITVASEVLAGSQNHSPEKSA